MAKRQKKISKIILSLPAKRLLKRGRDQGFVTQDDILEIFPDAERKIEELDELYSQLLEESVDVFETITPAEGEVEN